ncbi:uncharacterized protein LOC133182896 [Saccostrea echinata]|uniref:uncharacterized protein LOC133182896 n=1 Tax=Saccostrea echinata TaxID=191078 RepID=UPI002A8229E8|nr:uncharacterized protein LOC133182896 [Saccostrea echinata]
MDPKYSAQDVMRCALCDTPVPSMHCDFCHVNLCKNCVEEHLSDLSIEHKVVPFKERGSTPIYPKCLYHDKRHCELYCEKCDIPVCSTCISSGKHKRHRLSDALKIFRFKSKVLEKDLKELENIVYPKYREIVSDIRNEKVNLEKHYNLLETTVTKHGEVWHTEIDAIIDKEKSEINKMRIHHLAVLKEHSDNIQQKISEMEKTILNLQEIFKNRDVSLASTYISRNAEFKELPSRLHVALPKFYPMRINAEQLHQQFGSFISTNEYGYRKKAPETAYFKPLLDTPIVINSMSSEYNIRLGRIACLTDEILWTCGNGPIMKLYNLHCELLQSIKTESGNSPADIAVTRNGNLVYTDNGRRTVNIVRRKEIKSLIRLLNWRPSGVCMSSTNDLLVALLSEDGKQSKVVRYSGSKEIQVIQFDVDGKPLYSSGYYCRFITENRNQNICVADLGAHAVVVVNKAGHFLFRYTGSSNTDYFSSKRFEPSGITTDSQSRILIADSDNNFIHILDQYGYFLRFIEGFVSRPVDLCMDTKDNLLVADHSGLVKKIKYTG